MSHELNAKNYPDVEVAIVGAGLSGLLIADALANAGVTVRVFEARDRVGGRIHSVSSASQNDYRYDLGPAWIWPHNRRLLTLTQKYDLQLMPQHATGRLVFENGQGQIRRDLELSTMEGSLRVEGGAARLPQILSEQLPSDVLQLGHEVERIHNHEQSLILSGTGSAGDFSITAQRVVFALPPRLVAEKVSFSPQLSSFQSAGLSAVPTWMASHGKVVAVYENAFWREAGLSGDAISHRGPLFEIHDASPVAAAAGEAALFGFIDPSLKEDPASAGFRESVISQLTDLFGPDAASPLDILVKSWRLDKNTATEKDGAELGGHPVYRPIELEEPWRGRVLLSGSETAQEDGGFLEGAVVAAQSTASVLLKDLAS